MSRILARISIVAAVVAAAVAVAVPIGATQSQPPSFSSATRTVAVYATVTDGRGRLVTDLTRDDFSVDDNGKRQTLTLFSNDIQPITLVMLLDRSSSMKPNFDLEAQGAEAFVRSMGPGDKARIGSFANEIRIDPDDFTSDREKLLRIIRQDLQEPGPTPLWNAVDRAIDKLLIEQGRRVVLVFTDGVDRPLNFASHNKSLKDVSKRAEEHDIMVYAIGLAGDNGMPGQSGDRNGRGAMGPGAIGGLGGRGMGGYSGRQTQLEGPDEGLPEIAAATGGGDFEPKVPAAPAAAVARGGAGPAHPKALGHSP